MAAKQTTLIMSENKTLVLQRLAMSAYLEDIDPESLTEHSVQEDGDLDGDTIAQHIWCEVGEAEGDPEDAVKRLQNTIEELSAVVQCIQGDAV